MVYSCILRCGRCIQVLIVGNNGILLIIIAGHFDDAAVFDADGDTGIVGNVLPLALIGPLEVTYHAVTVCIGRDPV